MGKRIRKITYAFLIVALFMALNTKVSYAERKQLNIEQAVGKSSGDNSLCKWRKSFKRCRVHSFF